MSLLFQWPKNVQVIFLVCPSNVADFLVVIVTDFNIVTTRSPPRIIVNWNWPHPIGNFNVSTACIVNINVLYYISSHRQYLLRLLFLS